MFWGVCGVIGTETTAGIPAVGQQGSCCFALAHPSQRVESLLGKGLAASLALGSCCVLSAQTTVCAG